jgi:hypothetical protein
MSRASWPAGDRRRRRTGAQNTGIRELARARLVDPPARAPTRRTVRSERTRPPRRGRRSRSPRSRPRCSASNPRRPRGTSSVRRLRDRAPAASTWRRATAARRASWSGPRSMTAPRGREERCGRAAPVPRVRRRGMTGVGPGEWTAEGKETGMALTSQVLSGRSPKDS